MFMEAAVTRHPSNPGRATPATTTGAEKNPGPMPQLPVKCEQKKTEPVAGPDAVTKTRF
jgi:hypothetical protein